jgi:hypothetical protein
MRLLGSVHTADLLKERIISGDWIFSAVDVEVTKRIKKKKSALVLDR